MKTDKQGCSMCPAGQEQYEEFSARAYPQGPKAKRIQYDYRLPNGILFSCIAKDLEEARKRRDEWLKKTIPQP